MTALRTGGGGGDKPHVLNGWRVRRLTPRECERLQGFPDDYTRIPYRGGFAADGPRYKALGNSWAVPKFAYVGARIAEINRRAMP
jgi:DNA (cytosine-5)-methyltransferase 1